MMKTNNFLSNLDIYSLPFYPKIKQRIKFSNTITVVLTIILLLFTAVLFASKLTMFIAQREFTTIAYSVPTNREIVNEITPEQLTFLLIISLPKIENQTLRVKDLYQDSIVNSIKLTQNGNEYLYSTEEVGQFLPCSSPKIEEKYKIISQKMLSFDENKEDYFCLDIKQNLLLGGMLAVTGSQHYTNISISFDKCKLYQEECREEGNDFNVALTNNLPDKNLMVGVVYETMKPNYSIVEGFEKIVASSFGKLKKNYNQMNMEISAVRTEIQSDESYLLNLGEETSSSFIAFTGMNTSFENLVDRKKININLNFVIQDFEILIKRKYMKIDEFLAQFFVIVQMAWLALKSVNLLLNKRSADDFLLSNLYFTENIAKRSKETELNLGFEAVETNSFKKVYRKELPHKTLKLKCFKRDNHSTFKRNALKYIQYDSDMLTIVKRGLLVEKMAKVLFTNRQIELLGFINNRRIVSELDVEKQLIESTLINPTSKEVNKFKEVHSEDDHDLLSKKIKEEIKRHSD